MKMEIGGNIREDVKGELGGRRKQTKSVVDVGRSAYKLRYVKDLCLWKVVIPAFMFMSLV